MLFLKNGSISLLISFILTLLLTFIITLLNYINVIGINFVNIFSYIVPFISFLIGSFILGKKSLSKGWLEGLKLGLISIFILFIFNFLAFDSSLTINNIILYATVFISNVLGGMFGINIKKDH